MMTNLEFLIEKIKTRTITTIPTDLTSKELVDYLNGYAQCQKDIIDFITELAKPQY